MLKPSTLLCVIVVSGECCSCGDPSYCGEAARREMSTSGGTTGKEEEGEVRGGGGGVV